MEKWFNYLESVEKNCGRDLRVRLQGALKNLTSPVVKIVNTGMVSSGKSSLYNVLTGHTADEYFPIGAARTTTSAKTCEYKGLEYIDTPGIDVQDVDDAIAFRTVMESDLIMMVHNVKTGPLNRSEIDWLSHISSSMSDDTMRGQRLLFICTWKDAREKEPGYEGFIESLKDMVYGTVGTTIPFFDVSVMKYLTGISKEKPLLCKNSGVVELKNFIENYAERYVKIKGQVSRSVFEQVASEVCSALVQLNQEKTQAKDKLAAAARRKFKSQRSGWNDVFTYFKDRRKSLSSLNSDLKNM